MIHLLPPSKDEIHRSMILLRDGLGREQRTLVIGRLPGELIIVQGITGIVCPTVEVSQDFIRACVKAVTALSEHRR